MDQTSSLVCSLVTRCHRGELYTGSPSDTTLEEVERTCKPGNHEWCHWQAPSCVLPSSCKMCEPACSRSTECRKNGKRCAFTNRHRSSWGACARLCEALHPC